MCACSQVCSLCGDRLGLWLCLGVYGQRPPSIDAVVQPTTSQHSGVVLLVGKLVVSVYYAYDWVWCRGLDDWLDFVESVEHTLKNSLKYLKAFPAVLETC